MQRGEIGNLPEIDARAITECHYLSVVTSFSLIPRSHNTCHVVWVWGYYIFISIHMYWWQNTLHSSLSLVQLLNIWSLLSWGATCLYGKTNGTLSKLSVKWCHCDVIGVRWCSYECVVTLKSPPPPLWTGVVYMFHVCTSLFFQFCRLILIYLIPVRMLLVWNTVQNVTKNTHFIVACTVSPSVCRVNYPS